jgi:uncharacterized protein Yka (UPF0111/DUF47 family)
MTKRVPKSVGSIGLKKVGEFLLDEELQENLRFPKSIRTFDRMESDPLISGSLALFKQFIRSTSIIVEPKGGVRATDSAKQKAELTRQALFENMERSFDEVVTDALSFIKYGFSFLAPSFYIRKGLITWKDFSARPQSTIKGFDIDEETGRINTVYQCKPTQYYSGKFDPSKPYIEIPYNKLLHFRADSEKNNPIGRSVLKNAYYAWFFKHQLQEVEAIGMEKNLEGVPRFHIPSQVLMSDEEDSPEYYQQYLHLEETARNLRRNEQGAIFLPSDRDDSGNLLYFMDLLTADSKIAADIAKAIERYDYRVVQSLSTDFMMMGAGSSGSFALSDNKLNTLTQSLEAYLKVIVDQFNRKAIPEFYRLNSWSEDDMCKLAYKPISSATLTELADAIKKVEGFLTPDLSLENHLRTEMGLPEKDESTAYLSKPTSSYQADSQRIGMEKAALKASSQSDPLVEELTKSLEGKYNGEA